MRQGGALLLGGGVLGAALVFASRPLGVVGLGLLLAGAVARAFVAGGVRPVDVRTTIAPNPATEGDAVTLAIHARRSSRFSFGATTVTARLEGHGAFECRLRRRGGRLRGQIGLGRLPRGSYEVRDLRFERRDPLGLETHSQAHGLRLNALVHPRLVELRTLFDDTGRSLGDGRRFLMHRPSGYDFHSVREYERGESLRRVHWPTTARRGQLMVKELEDSPREALVVVLDCDPASAVGVPAQSSFDTAVRAAGSILRTHATRGRCAALVTTSLRAETVAPSLEGEVRSLLDELAAVNADAAHDLVQFLARPPASVARAAELVVVTATQSPLAANRLLDLAAKRAVAVVWIDAPSYAGRPTRAAPAILRLSASGIPVAVVRRGDDLASALEAPAQVAIAGG